MLNYLDKSKEGACCRTGLLKMLHVAFLFSIMSIKLITLQGQIADIPRFTLVNGFVSLN